MMTDVRVGFLGAGRVTDQHVDAVLERSDSRITQVFDPDDGRARAFVDTVHGAERAVSAEALLSSDVDAVVISAPTQTHFELASAALAAGKHVLMEKPFTRNAAEADRLRETAEARDLVCMPAQVARFLPAVRAIRERTLGADSGQLVQAIERRLTYRTEVFPWWQSVPEFLIAHWGSHSLDVFLWLAGDEADEVKCWASSRQKGYDSVDDFTLVAHTRGGAVISLHQTFASREECLDWLMIWEGDTAAVDGMASARWNTETVISGDLRGDMRDAFSHQAAEFIGACRGARQLETTIASVLPSIRALEAAAADAGIQI